MVFMKTIKFFVCDFVNVFVSKESNNIQKHAQSAKIWKYN